MNKKKVVSQILIFAIFLIIIILGIIIQDNNKDLNIGTNTTEYANLNINKEELNTYKQNNTLIIYDVFNTLSTNFEKNFLKFCICVNDVKQKYII